MDKDELVQRWEPIGPATEGSVPSYQAKGPDGQFAQVHQILDETDESRRLLGLVRRLQSDPPPDLVEVLELGGGVAVVTHILPAQVTLEVWLKGHVPPEDSVTASDETGPNQEEGPGGQDYSAYFKVPQQDPGPQAPPPPTEPEEPSSPDVPSDGEGYTSLFQAAPSQPEQRRQPREPEPPPPPPPPPPQRPSPTPAPPPTQAPRSDSITDMFRRPEAPPPRQPDLHRDEGWSQSQRDLSPLRITLDEYIRRLQPAGGGDRGFRRESAGGGMARAAPAPHGWDQQADRESVTSAPAAGKPHSAKPVKKSRDLILLVSVLGFVTVVAVAVILFLLLRGG